MSNSACGRVLVVEDDTDLRDKVLLPGLRRFGFEVVGVGSAIELYKWMVNNTCTLVVLDVGLPDDDGFAIAKHLRETTSAGIIMLTGRDSKVDHMRALTEGADVYFTKPPDVELLACALQNLSRRISAPENAAIASVVDARWKFEADGWRLVSPTGGVVALSIIERIIVQKLQSADRPTPREELVDELVNVIEDFDPSRLEMVIHRLRRKVHSKTGQELPLTALRKFGYMLSI